MTANSKENNSLQSFKHYLEYTEQDEWRIRLNIVDKLYSLVRWVKAKLRGIN